MTRGFHDLPPEARARVARLGGLRAHVLRVAHEFTPEQARAAGKKGGNSLLASRGPEYFKEIGKKGGRCHSKEHMSALGKKGGAAAALKRLGPDGPGDGRTSDCDALDP